MSTLTNTLAVNAAFLREIKEDNVHLQKMLQGLRVELTRPRPLRVSIRWLHERVCPLRDQLAVHFSLEETFGYFEDAVSVAPHLSGRADALQAEHETLFRQLCSLAEDIERCRDREDSASQMEGLVDDYLRFDQCLQEHERDENELIMLAFVEDIGVGD